jgi:hypothetical protein
MGAGRPLKFENKELLIQKIEEFFDLIKKENEIPSVVGLAIHLGTNKQTLLNYQDREDFRDIIEDAKQKIEAQFTAKAYSGDIPPAIFIFTSKNHYGYKDEQHRAHSGSLDLKRALDECDGTTAGLPADDSRPKTE